MAYFTEQEYRDHLDMYLTIARGLHRDGLEKVVTLIAPHAYDTLEIAREVGYRCRRRASSSPDQRLV